MQLNYQLCMEEQTCKYRNISRMENSGQSKVLQPRVTKLHAMSYREIPNPLLTQPVSEKMSVWKQFLFK